MPFESTEDGRVVVIDSDIVEVGRIKYEQMLASQQLVNVLFGLGLAETEMFEEAKAFLETSSEEDGSEEEKTHGDT